MKDKTTKIRVFPVFYLVVKIRYFCWKKKCNTKGLEIKRQWMRGFRGIVGIVVASSPRLFFPSYSSKRLTAGNELDHSDSSVWGPPLYSFRCDNDGITIRHMQEGIESTAVGFEITRYYRSFNDGVLKRFPSALSSIPKYIFYWKGALYPHDFLTEKKNMFRNIIFALSCPQPNVFNQKNLFKHGVIGPQYRGTYALTQTQWFCFFFLSFYP